MTAIQAPITMPAPTRRVTPLGGLRNTFTLTWRSVLKIRTNMEDVIGLSLQPIMFLLLFTYVFGGAIAHGSTHTYLQYELPGLLVMTVVFATLGTGLMLNQDISSGVFDRFRSLPIARWAPLAGAVLGDMVRYLISVAITIAFGMILGFRVTTNPVSAVAGCLLLLAFALAMCWVSAAATARIVTASSPAASARLIAAAATAARSYLPFGPREPCSGISQMDIGVSLATLLHVRVAGAGHAHLFVRLCDVDPQGRSWNVTDGILRLTPGALTEEAVTVAMSSAAHQFAPGHRLRLQVSGGAHPRFARNTGTGEPLATATRLVPTDIEVYHDRARPSALLLPAADTAPAARATASS